MRRDKLLNYIVYAHTQICVRERERKLILSVVIFVFLHQKLGHQLFDSFIKPELPKVLSHSSLLGSN